MTDDYCPYCGKWFCDCIYDRVWDDEKRAQKRREKEVVDVPSLFKKIERYELTGPEGGGGFYAEGDKKALHVTNGQSYDSCQEVTLNEAEQIALAQVIAEKHGFRLVYK